MTENYKCIVTILVGVYLLILAIIRIVKRKKILQDFNEVLGVIVDIKSDNYRGVFYPVVKFKGTDKFIVKKGNDGHYPSKYFIGQEVLVQYSKEKEENFIIKDGGGYSKEIFFLLIGLGFLLFGTYCFIR